LGLLLLLRVLLLLLLLLLPPPGLGQSWCWKGTCHWVDSKSASS
jgi:hypothetical protein